MKCLKYQKNHHQRERKNRATKIFDELKLDDEYLNKLTVNYFNIRWE